VLLVELTLSRRRTALTEDLTPTERRQFFYQGLLVDVRAAKEIRLFGAGPFLHARMLTALRAAVNAENTLDRRTVLLQGGLAVLGGVLTGTALVVTVHAALAGTLSLGDVALFLAAVGGAQMGALMTIREVAVAYGSLTLFRHYLAVVNADDDLVQGTARPRRLRDGIELRDVWFRYSDDQPWILRGINLHLPAGSAVGLVGVNGAGKSTLVKLLCRFYDPQRGQILWDGVDIRELSCDALRSRIAAVFQDYMCYDLTARENIALGQISALPDDDRIRSAARLAEADEAIRRLPRGYDTMLSRIFFGDDDDQGVILSGGQWQRLALARSILREDCDLVILDEPSSGLDPEAEYRVQRTLREQRRGTANLLISHRLNTLRDADQIAVLACGEVVELGTHDELMAAQGEYARLFLMQASGYQDPVGLAADGAGVTG
jgi:ATP-binding cassette subfamily B protein